MIKISADGKVDTPSIVEYLIRMGVREDVAKVSVNAFIEIFEHDIGPCELIAALRAIGPDAEVLANSESLEAHGLSVTARLRKLND